MNDLKVYFWIVWLLLVIGPLAIILNYRLLKNEGVAKKDLVKKLLNPFRIPRPQQIGPKDKAILWCLILSTLFWFAFPFVAGIK